MAKARAQSTRSSAGDALATYIAKRDFSKTSEPDAHLAESGSTLIFAIQKHAASRLHYDLRLELDGVLLSWAMPRGPSFDPKQKRMAVRTENHPMMYASWEGVIPAKQYGAGTMIVWDQGTWEPHGDARAALAVGKLIFHLHGQKLAGLWELVRIQKAGEKQEPWMLFKKRDAWGAVARRIRRDQCAARQRDYKTTWSRGEARTARFSAGNSFADR